MLKFNNFPPEKPEDVEWSAEAELIFSGKQATYNPDDLYVIIRTVGRCVGTLLTESLIDANEDIIERTIHNLIISPKKPIVLESLWATELFEYSAAEVTCLSLFEPIELTL